jgi:hypothetical protein
MNRINFDKMEVKAGGITYKIETDAISYPRLVEYLDLMPVVAIGKSHLEIMNTVGVIYKQMTSGGEDFKQTYWNVSMTAYNLLRNMDGVNSKEFLQNNLDNILRFCALFCIAPGEDTTKYVKSEIDAKIENFKKDCDMFDFFLLAKKLVPLYSQKLTDMNEAVGVLKKRLAKKI